MGIDKFVECWGNVESWLNVSATVIFSSLNVPAEPLEIKAIEDYYGLTFPADFHALYSAHNGQNTSELVNLFYGLPFLSLQEGQEIQENMIVPSLEYIDFSEFIYVSKEVDRSTESPLFKFPISGGIDAYGVFIDLKPSELGRYGQIVFIDLESNVVVKVADSITDMVCSLHSGLIDGGYSLSSEEHINPGEWFELSKELDVVNWYAYNQDNLPPE